MTKVARPIVRSFKARFAEACAAWVRRGGHAIFWEAEERGRLVVPRINQDDVMDLGLWSIMDLGLEDWDDHARGVFRGLSSVLVPRSLNHIARKRVVRDSIHEGPLRMVRFDCLACAACCRDNEVILEKKDITRFAEGGRPELAKPPLAVRRGGKVVLTLLRNKDCRHLAADRTCAIYTLRPNACRDFPVGSECCLFAREEELNVLDGARD
jgi:Fe-S-cluster containining protein